MIHNILIPISLCLIGYIYTSNAAPSIHILIPSGWLSYICLKHDMQKSLWASLSLGLLTDQASIDLPAGLFATIFCLCTFIIKKIRSYFSIENLGSLFLYAYSYSIICTILLQVAYTLLLPDMSISVLGLASSVFLSPLLDALFFLVFIYYPCYFIKKALQPKNIRLCKRFIREKKHVARKILQKLLLKLYARRP